MFGFGGMEGIGGGLEGIHILKPEEIVEIPIEPLQEFQSPVTNVTEPLLDTFEHQKSPLEQMAEDYEKQRQEDLKNMLANMDQKKNTETKPRRMTVGREALERIRNRNTQKKKSEASEQGTQKSKEIITEDGDRLTIKGKNEDIEGIKKEGKEEKTQQPKKQTKAKNNKQSGKKSVATKSSTVKPNSKPAVVKPTSIPITLSDPKVPGPDAIQLPDPAKTGPEPIVLSDPENKLIIAPEPEQVLKPKSEVPVTQEPKQTPEPKSETPIAQAPKQTSEPKSEAPVAQESKAQEPKQAPEQKSETIKPSETKSDSAPKSNTGNQPHSIKNDGVTSGKVEVKSSNKLLELLKNNKKSIAIAALITAGISASAYLYDKYNKNKANQNSQTNANI